jgi:putative ABC transport system substrate-binding protein
MLGLALGVRLHPAQGQPPHRTPRVGFLYFGSRKPGPGGERYAAFLEGMRELGYVNGKDVLIEARFADSHADRLPALVGELLRTKTDVIVATASPTYRALQRATTTVPIVVTVTADPILEGVATTLSRPGGNFTGLTDTAADLSMKQLELLKAMLPKLTRVGVLANPDNVSHPAQTSRLLLAGQKFGVQVTLAEARTTAQIEPALALLAQDGANAVILFGDTFFAEEVRQIAQAALKQRMPSVFILRRYAEVGGLISYGAPIINNFRRAASYVDKILKGANPAELPFEQPTTYELVINAGTARALGLAIPQTIRVRADEIVE